MQSTAAVAALALAAATLAAQQRRVLAGDVRGPDGGPVARASVRFVYVARGAEEGDPTDDVTVVADANGAWRAEILPCAPYRVWALGPASADGSCAASALRLVDAEPFLRLHATHRATPRTVRIDGLDAWREQGPFRVRVLPAGIQIRNDVIDLREQHVDLPPLPVVLPPSAPAVVLQLLTNRGEVLAAIEDDDGAVPVHWQLDAPLRQDVRVVDGGQPAADVEVLELASRIAPRHTELPVDPPERLDWRALGRTGADGRLRAVALTSADPALYARAADGRVSVTLDPHRRALSQRIDGAERVLSLGPAKEWRVRVDRIDGARASGCASRLFAGTGDLRTEVAIEADGEGRFRLPSEGLAFAAAPHAAWATLLPEPLRANAPTPPVAFSVLPVHLAIVRDLTPRWTLQLEVVTATGSPATRAQIVLGSDGYVSSWSWHAIPDQAGRIAVAVTEDDWIVFAYDDTSAGTARVRAKPDGPLRIQLQPLPVLRGRVVDAQGRPVAGAQLEEESVWRTPRPHLDGGLDRIASFRNAEAIARCRSAADGTFVCAFVQAPSLDWLVHFRDGERSSAPMLLEPATDLRVELR